ncbi:MAG: hypothetical protein K0S76_2182 [Herbinix sp.]|jgi:uncharacterized protein YdhG (YjbR/CyaY superfamily)|nr:hypothetical protein [Herbinix sp.]
MEENKVTYQTIDEYIASYPQEIQDIMIKLRNVIKEAAPKAQEKISWQMPTFALYGNLVHFAGHKNHLGFYPAPNGIEAFWQELTEYKQSKGAIQFPYNKPIPYELIGRIVKFRVEENIKLNEEKLSNKSQVNKSNQ